MEKPTDLLPVIIDYCINYNFGRDKDKILTLSIIKNKKKAELKITTHSELYDALVKIYK